MSISKQVRNKSLKKVKPEFNAQEIQVINCIKSGMDNCWAIQADTNMLITSVRRCLTNLDKRDVIFSIGQTYNAPTDSHVTRYKLIDAGLKV